MISSPPSFILSPMLYLPTRVTRDYGLNIVTESVGNVTTYA